MDINLPGISGTEAMKILREYPETAHIPIVAISANAMPQDIARGLEAGFFRYLTKPIKIKEFEETLREALAFAKETSAALTPDVLLPLPDELINRLKEAAMDADNDLLLSLANEVERYDKQKSHDIKRFLEAFDYQRLLDAIQPGGKM